MLRNGGRAVKPYNKGIVPLAKNLRKEMTPEERKLWYLFLKPHPVKFRRQATIENYIVDFYCPQARVIIEIDGSQHFVEEGLRSDQRRTALLESVGLRVVRFSNRQINEEFNGVCQYIDSVLKECVGEEYL